MKQVVFGIIIVATLGIIGFAVFGMGNEPTTSSSPGTSSQNTTSNQQPNENNANLETYTTDEVAMHATEEDCWTIIEGNVYDITSYIPRHSGGDEILRACGVDSTTLFTQRKTDEGERVGSGTPHSSSATAQLSSLQIGVLAN